MTCYPAPACKALLSEALRNWPKRNVASDGICASPRHTQQNPTSDHEVGNAVDLTDDPANGCDAHLLVAQIVARHDKRVKYAISQGRIARSYNKPGIAAWTWAKYTGSNPHDKHAHISIHADARNDTSPWFTTPTQPKPQQEVDEMPMSCVVPWVPRLTQSGRVAFLEVIPVAGANEAVVVSYNGAPFTPPWDDANDGDDVLFGFWARRMKALTGPPVGIDVAPDGQSVVVTCRGGGTYDVAKKP